MRAVTGRRLFLNQFVPWALYLSGTVAGVVILYWVRKRLFRFKETVKFYLTDFATIIVNTFLSGIAFGSLIYWGFIFLNDQLTKDDAVIDQQVAIYSISLKSTGTSNSIYFKWMGTEQSINNFRATDIIRKAAMEGDYEKYRLQLSLRKGLLNSYAIEGWSVVAVDR
jgi:hypothetical protein